MVATLVLGTSALCVSVRVRPGAPIKGITMPMYETSVRTSQGEEKKRIYAATPQEAKKLFEQLYGGPRAVPYIPKVVPS